MSLCVYGKINKVIKTTQKNRTKVQRKEKKCYHAQTHTHNTYIFFKKPLNLFFVFSFFSFL